MPEPNGLNRRKRSQQSERGGGRLPYRQISPFVSFVAFCSNNCASAATTEVVHTAASALNDVGILYVSYNWSNALPPPHAVDRDGCRPTCDRSWVLDDRACPRMAVDGAAES